MGQTLRIGDIDQIHKMLKWGTKGTNYYPNIGKHEKTTRGPQGGPLSETLFIIFDEQMMNHYQDNRPEKTNVTYHGKQEIGNGRMNGHATNSRNKINKKVYAPNRNKKW